MGSLIDQMREKIAKQEQFTVKDGVRSCWQTAPGVSFYYVLYRWFQFLVNMIYWDMSFFEIGRQFNPLFETGINAPRTIKFYLKWFLYLTHWGLLVNLIQSFLGAVLVQKAYNSQREGGHSEMTVSRPLLKLYHRMFVTSLNLSVFIASAFWLWVFDPDETPADPLNLSEHGLCTLFLTIDLFIMALPYKLFYGFYSVAVVTVYLIMTYVHHLFEAYDRYQDKTYIYKKNDWEEPDTVVFYFACSIVALSGYNILLWMLFLLRKRLSPKRRVTPPPQPHGPPQHTPRRRR